MAASVFSSSVTSCSGGNFSPPLQLAVLSSFFPCFNRVVLLFVNWQWFSGSGGVFSSVTGDVVVSSSSTESSPPPSLQLALSFFVHLNNWRCCFSSSSISYNSKLTLSWVRFRICNTVEVSKCQSWLLHLCQSPYAVQSIFPFNQQTTEFISTQKISHRDLSCVW